MNRINIITLGVRDMIRSLKFYRDELPDIVFFSNNVTKLALFPLNGLAEDIGENKMLIVD